MDNILDCYIVQDDNAEELVYGCLLVNRNYDFDPELFQARLNKESGRTDLDTYSEVVTTVLSKYPEDYKNIEYIKNKVSFFI